MTQINPDAFRSLVEGRITTEQYLRTIKERAEELREPEPPEQRATSQAA
jgi:hypothetical protein